LFEQLLSYVVALNGLNLANILDISNLWRNSDEEPNDAREHQNEGVLKILSETKITFEAIKALTDKNVQKYGQVQKRVFPKEHLNLKKDPITIIVIVFCVAFFFPRR
jgi:hypothetical protein